MSVPSIDPHNQTDGKHPTTPIGRRAVTTTPVDPSAMLSEFLDETSGDPGMVRPGMVRPDMIRCPTSGGLKRGAALSLDPDQQTIKRHQKKALGRQISAPGGTSTGLSTPLSPSSNCTSMNSSNYNNSTSPYRSDTSQQIVSTVVKKTKEQTQKRTVLNVIVTSIIWFFF